MKRTVKKSVCNDALTLLEVIEQRKELEKREKYLKEKFKTLLGDEVAIDANGVLITLTERERTSLDKKELAKVVDLKKYEKKSTYKVMNVKKA